MVVKLARVCVVVVPVIVTPPDPGVNVPLFVKFPSSVKRKVEGFNVAPLLIARLPLIVIATPNVVVPAEIVRLLKLVKVAFGRVLLAPRTTAPVPYVKVFAPVLAPFVIGPFTVNVPPFVIVIVAVSLPAVDPIARLLHVKLDPLSNVIVPLSPLAAYPTVTDPETVTDGLPEVANASVPVPAAVPKLKEAQTAFVTSTVSVAPVPTFITSEELGCPPVPEPMVILLQLVLVVIVIVTAIAIVLMSTTIVSRMII